MNKKEGKKIAVMAAVIMGLMMFAFMPMVSATVTDFTVTPSTGLAGAVDSYNALVTTDGVTTINITIPAGFIAVTPTTGGVLIAEVNFWNSTSKAPTTGGVLIAEVNFWNSTSKAYYGYATIKSSNTNPTTKVDIYCEFGGETATTTQNVSYAPGATNTFVSCFGDGSSAIIKLPREKRGGSIKITITSTDFQLDEVMIAIKQFVRNPMVAGDYVFSADGVDATVRIAAGGRGIGVFRDGVWHVDTNGDYVADMIFAYGLAGDDPLVGDINQDGNDDTALFRDGVWHVDTNGDYVADMIFAYGLAGDDPLVGDINQDGTDDTALFRDGVWHVDTNRDLVAAIIFAYGIPGDDPVVGGIR
jgi:hypothetical protein